MASIRERNGKFNVIYSYTNEKGERKQKWAGHNSNTDKPEMINSLIEEFLSNI